ncbi:glycosyltransferase family A protein [Azospirillum sp. A26]|uniref:glycosyltransferase family 2 protein n=1 Tax=Azospirillum sp. A26 TaxID=3160607 RepID=UPI00366A94E3
MTLSVSAVIATYNRGPELRIALTRLMTQTTPPMEIIVIDDGSSDGTGAMMRAEFPTVRYVRQPHNGGLILARNFGFVNTTGDCILSVDDDSWFEDPDGLARCVAYLEDNPEVAAVACNIETRDGLVYFPKGAAPFDVPWYVGCGHLLRRSAVEQVGLYMPELYRQGEEKDRCLRLVGAGYRVVALPDIMVYHDKSEKGRKPGMERFYNHRNDLIREVARCPSALMAWRLARTWAGNSWKNLRNGPRLTDLKVLLALPEIVRIGRKHRAPVSVEAYNRWLHLAKTAAPASAPPTEKRAADKPVSRAASRPVAAERPSPARSD